MHGAFERLTCIIVALFRREEVVCLVGFGLIFGQLFHMLSFLLLFHSVGARRGEAKQNEQDEETTNVHQQNTMAASKRHGVFVWIKARKFHDGYLNQGHKNKEKRSHCLYVQVGYSNLGK